MKYSDIYKQALGRKTLIRLSSTRSRDTFLLLSTFLFFITTICWLLFGFSVFLENPILPVFLTERLLGLSSVSLSLFLSVFAGLILSHTTAGSGLTDLYKKDTRYSLELMNSLTQVKSNPLATLTSSRYGKNLLRRLNLDPESLKAYLDKNTMIRECILPEHAYVTSKDFAQALYKQDKDFSDWLFSQNINTETFTGANEMTAATLNDLLTFTPGWYLSVLGRTQGIATDWSYGSAYSLRQYSRAVEARTDTPLPHIKEALTDTERALSRDRESDVIVVGKNGDGHADIPGYIANRISRREAPLPLENHHIFEFDYILFETSFPSKTEYESNLIKILNDAVESGNIILVINHFDQFIRSAEALGVGVDAILSDYLGHYRLQIIATVDTENFESQLRFNSTIAQRFSVVKTKESTEYDTVTALAHNIVELEKHSGTFYSYQAVKSAAHDGARFIPNFIMPDTVLDILSESSALALSKGSRNVTAEETTEVISRSTHIPTGAVSKEESALLSNLEEALKERVVGQKQALKSVAQALRRSRTGTQSDARPMGVFLFVGPTGVGKTEVARSLAFTLFENEDTMSRLDMAEFSGDDGLEKLIGSFENGNPGILIENLRTRPYGVLLLDEFEKASPEVHNALLPLFDEGYISDGTGRRVSARNAIIIATSNAGANYLWNITKDKPEMTESVLHEELLEHFIAENIFRPELLNRFDDIVVFNQLSKDEEALILEKMLEKTAQRLESQQSLRVTFSPETKANLLSAGFHPEFGARPLKRAIQNQIEDEIAKSLLSGEAKPGDTLNL